MDCMLLFRVRNSRCLCRKGLVKVRPTNKKLNYIKGNQMSKLFFFRRQDKEDLSMNDILILIYRDREKDKND